MKKQIHILEGIIILIIIFLASLLGIKFIYNINHEKMDTTYMWNIEFNNLQVTEGSKEAAISLDNNLVTVDVILENEEFYEFTLDIINKGSFDAKLDNIDINVSNPKNILQYSVIYENEEEIKVGDILESNTTKTIKVLITYPKQKDKIYDALELKLSLSMTYVSIH